ncbi:MAG: hypothetical protein U0903_08245 [Planctomycetales bacterium]
MTTMTKPSPIAGVSPTREAVVAIVYPSIAATGLGKELGKLYDSIPTKIWGIKVSQLLFALPTSPVALLLYFYLKALGVRYVLTNHAVQTWAALGNRKVSQVALTDIASIDIYESSGHQFYEAGDLYLIGKSGEHLAILQGIPYPKIFRQTIMETRDARQQVASSLERIKARG